MLAAFFIARPKFAFGISIVSALVGVICLFQLPIAVYSLLFWLPAEDLQCSLEESTAFNFPPESVGVQCKLKTRK